MVTCRKKLDYARLFWITLCFCFRGPDASAQSLFGAQHPISLEPDQSEVEASGDLDGDGDMDLVVGSRNVDRKTNRGLIWYENQHASGYYVERSIEFRNIAVSDVQLFDLLGRRQSGSIKSVLTAGRGRRVRLDTSRLAAGAYIARVTVSGQRGLQKSVPLVVIR